MPDRLLFAVSGVGATSAVTNTIFAPLPFNGMILPVDTLKALVAKPKVHLWAWLLPPAGGSIEIRLAIQQDMAKRHPLPGTIVRVSAPASGPVWMRAGGGVVEITDQLKGDSIAFAIVARVSTGAGNVTMPTIAVLGAA